MGTLSWLPDRRPATGNSHLDLAPPGRDARGILGLDPDLGEGVVLLHAALGRLEAVLELGVLLLEEQHAGLALVGAPRPGDLGIAELPLECREEVHRVAAPVGPGDLPLLLAE